MAQGHWGDFKNSVVEAIINEIGHFQFFLKRIHFTGKILLAQLVKLFECAGTLIETVFIEGFPISVESAR